MSYILDALQKSERKRKRDYVPDLQTVHSPASPKKRKGSLWAWLLVAILMITVVLLVLYLPDRRRDNYLTGPVPDKVEKPAASRSLGDENLTKEISSGRQNLPERDTDAADYVAEMIPATTPPEIYEEMEPSSADVPVAYPSQVQDPSSPSRPDISDQRGGRYEEKMPTAREDTSPSAAALVPVTDVTESDEEYSTAEIPVPKPHLQPETEIPLLTSLPKSLRQNIPELTISFHVFTQNPATRLVSINGRIVRQGQEVTPDLNLEEITAAGIVLNYKGNRFRLQVF